MRSKKFIFTAWEGADRTTGDALCLIAEANGNAADVQFPADPFGQRDHGVRRRRGGGRGPLHPLRRRRTRRASARRELWAEAGSIEDAGLLGLFAQNKLNETGVKTTVIATLIDSGACRYERDYDVGDTVLISGALRQRGGAECTEMTETYENGARRLYGELRRRAGDGEYAPEAAQADTTIGCDRFWHRNSMVSSIPLTGTSAVTNSADMAAAFHSLAANGVADSGTSTESIG